MTFATLLSLVTIAAVAAFTPGPNNTLVANSSAKHGFMRTVPMIFGIGIGFPFMVFCVAIGLGALFEQSNLLREALRIIGIVVLVWMAWKIASAGASKNDRSELKPLGFIKMAAFQWINPKGWVMTTSITSQFVMSDRTLFSACIIAGVFTVMGFTSASSWALFGTTMQRWLTNESRVRLFNVTMAALLLLSVGLIATAELG